MNAATIIMTAISLSMDAFAISISSGMCIKKVDLAKALKFGLFFGFFQFVMPIFGFMLAFSFEKYIKAFDHWVAFILLGLIGAKMIYESFKGEDGEVQTEESVTGTKNLLIMSIATSIDAMAVGISFVALQVNVLSASLAIGVITCIISTVGVIIGKKVGGLFKKGAEVFGGIILVAIGVKILLEHTIWEQVSAMM